MHPILHAKMRHIAEEIREHAEAIKADVAAWELGGGPIIARVRWKARQRLVRLIARRAIATDAPR